MPSAASNFDNQSLRSFLYMVETEHPDALLRIRQPVDPRIDMTATVFELERAGKSPVIIFEKPGASAMPVVTNVAANRKLLAACLGVEPENIAAAFRERCQKYIPCELVKDAAWNEVVIEGDDVDLSRFPIPLQFSIDGGPYITPGIVVSKDPETGVPDLGHYRFEVIDKTTLSFNALPNHRFGKHIAKARAWPRALSRRHRHRRRSGACLYLPSPGVGYDQRLGGGRRPARRAGRARPLQDLRP